MALNLQPLTFAIKCDGNELETHDVKLEGPNTTAFVASEAGKQFSVTFSNNLLDIDLSVALHIDGVCVYRCYLRAGQRGKILGIQKTANSVLPFKFQELELVDPDLENAPVVPEMGIIELRAYRCQAMRSVVYEHVAEYGLHQGRVSERSKKAGWHHVSTADEVPANLPNSKVIAYFFDPPTVPYATVKVFYRPRELLMAQGVITGHDVRAGIDRGSEVSDRKRAREDGALPGPSKRRTGSVAKKEEVSADARMQRIQALQAELQTELNSLKSGSSVKRELRSPSPIVVGRTAGEVVDLTLDD